MQAFPFGPYGFSIAVAVISIMIAVGGIIYGLGYALNEKSLKDFGRNELYQSVFNGAIVGGMLLLFMPNGVVTNLINNLTYGSNTSFSCFSYMTGNSALCFAYNYLAGTGPYTFAGQQHYSLLTIILGLLTLLFALEISLGLLASLQLSAMFVTFSPAALLKPFIAEIQYATELLTTIAMGVAAQAAVLAFIAISALTILLPVGIILRTFYPTRKLGGFIIAVAIGVYVVLPLSYLMNAALLVSYSGTFNSTSLEQVNLYASGFDGNYTILSGTNSTSGILGSMLGLIKSALSALAGALADLFHYIAMLIVEVFILPTFSLIITGISIKEFAEVLGSEAHFGKFRII